MTTRLMPPEFPEMATQPINALCKVFRATPKTIMFWRNALADERGELRREKQGVSPAMRSLIEQSLQARDVASTLKLFNSTLSPAPTLRQITSIRLSMVRAKRPVFYDPDIDVPQAMRVVPFEHSADAARDRLRAIDSKSGCDALANLTEALYQRETVKRGWSRDRIILTMQHGPEAAELWEARAA